VAAAFHRLPSTVSAAAVAAGASIPAKLGDDELWHDWHLGYELDEAQAALLTPAVRESVKAWLDCDPPEVCCCATCALDTTCSCLSAAQQHNALQRSSLDAVLVAALGHSRCTQRGGLARTTQPARRIALLHGYFRSCKTLLLMSLGQLACISSRHLAPFAVAAHCCHHLAGCATVSLASCSAVGSRCLRGPIPTAVVVLALMCLHVPSATAWELSGSCRRGCLLQAHIISYVRYASACPGVRAASHGRGWCFASVRVGLCTCI
jgi:hypothetical protein